MINAISKQSMSGNSLLGKLTAALLSLAMLLGIVAVDMRTAYASTSQVLVTIDLAGGTAINVENGVE